MTDFTTQPQTPVKAILVTALQAFGGIIFKLPIFAPRTPVSVSDRAARAVETARLKAEARQRVDNLLR